MPLTSAYTTCEAFGWETGVDWNWREAPAFYGLLAFFIGFAALFVMIPGLPLIQVMFAAQVAQRACCCRSSWSSSCCCRPTASSWAASSAAGILLLVGWTATALLILLSLILVLVAATGRDPAVAGVDEAPARYIITRPPSTARTWPVMKAASSVARKATALAISSVVPKRPSGVRRVISLLERLRQVLGQLVSGRTRARPRCR